jgi:hypothetical protein
MTSCGPIAQALSHKRYISCLHKNDHYMQDGIRVHSVAQKATLGELECFHVRLDCRTCCRIAMADAALLHGSCWTLFKPTMPLQPSVLT